MTTETDPLSVTRGSNQNGNHVDFNGTYLPNCTALHSEIRNFDTHRRQNLKSHTDCVTRSKSAQKTVLWQTGAEFYYVYKSQVPITQELNSEVVFKNTSLWSTRRL